MSTGVLFTEIIIGVACLLAWLALHLRGRKDWIAATLNMGAFLVGLHLALSYFMNGPITIFSFGVVIIFAFFIGTRYMLMQTRQLGIDDKKIFDWAFWLLVSGIVGARVLYAYLNYDHFAQSKWEILRIWNGGLVLYGGLIPGVIVAVTLAVRSKLPLGHITDIGLLGAILGLGIGRWACLLAGDDYGKPTDAWLGIRFYHEDSLIPSQLRGVPLHPTQMYMSLNCLWLFFLVETFRRKARWAGQAFGWLLIGYAVTRAAFIEPFRGDFVERNPGYARYVAAQVVIDKDEDSPAVSLKRGNAVRGTGGRTGVLLGDLELPAGKTSGYVYAISDEPAEARKEAFFRGGAPEWTLTTVDGLQDGVELARADSSRWYHSDLPQPPGYVSTSQWISIFVCLAGIAVLLLARAAKVPGFREAVAAAKT